MRTAAVVPSARRGRNTRPNLLVLYSADDDAAEWDEWDEESRLVYRFEWAIPRDRWHDLQQWAAEGQLTPEQRSRFEEIEALMEAHGATLARLLDPESDRDASEPSATNPVVS